MKNLLYIELKKALCNRFFVFSILLGFIFVVMSAYNVVTEFESGFMNMIHNVEEMGYIKYKITEGPTLYNSWIGGESSSLGFTLFFTLLPLLAILPYGHSFSEEKRSGYLKTVIPKCGRKNYFSAKILASFISGGLAVTIPLVFSLLLVAMFIPAVNGSPVYDQYFSVTHGNLFSELAHSNPMVFTIVYLCIDFIFSGLFACMSITAAFFFKQRLAPLVLPYLALLGADMARSFLYYVSTLEISPIKILHPMPIYNTTKDFIMLGWFFVFAAVTVPIILYRGCRHEIF